MLKKPSRPPPPPPIDLSISSRAALSRPLPATLPPPRSANINSANNINNTNNSNCPSNCHNHHHQQQQQQQNSNNSQQQVSPTATPTCLTAPQQLPATPPSIAPRSMSASLNDETPANLYIPISECHTGLPQQRYHQKSRSLGVGGPTAMGTPLNGATTSATISSNVVPPAAVSLQTHQGVQYLDLNLDNTDQQRRLSGINNHTHRSHHHQYHHSTGGSHTIHLGHHHHQPHHHHHLHSGSTPHHALHHQHRPSSSSSLTHRGSSSSMSLQSAGVMRSSPNHSIAESLESSHQTSTVYRTVDFERTKALNKTKQVASADKWRTAPSTRLSNDDIRQ